VVTTEKTPVQQPPPESAKAPHRIDSASSYAAGLNNSTYYDRNSQGYKTRQETVQLLVDQIFVEKEIEKVKLAFQETQGFSVYAVMALFDKEMRGSVSLVEFSHVAEGLLATPSSNLSLLRQELSQVFQKFDKDRDGYLDQAEMREFLLPIGDKRGAHVLENRRERDLSEDAMGTLRRLFEVQVRSINTNQFLLTRFSRYLERHYLTLKDAFGALDSHGRGFVSAYDLQDLLAENRRVCRAEELVQEVDLLIALYQRSRDPSRGITVGSFLEQLTPSPLLARSASFEQHQPVPPKPEGVAA
jgi:Ca2+-binding EF-hand superfamily protein